MTGSGGFAAACSTTSGPCDPRRSGVRDRRAHRRQLARISIPAAARPQELAPWLAGEARLRDLGRSPQRRRPPGDRYRNDPVDPTPSVGGPVLLSRHPVLDNRRLEARTDTLAYSGAALPEALEAIGPVRVEPWARDTSPYSTCSPRLRPRSRRRVLERVRRSGAGRAGRFQQLADRTWYVSFALWPITPRFTAGHRVRLQASSGAHPPYARNPGTGEDPNVANGPGTAPSQNCPG